MAEMNWSDGANPTPAEERLLAALAEERPMGKVPQAALDHLAKLRLIVFDGDEWQLTGRGIYAASLLAQAQAAHE